MPGAEASGFQAEINVTPLVDVVLVLLIIFMVVTPILRAEAEVHPPKTDNPPGIVDESPSVSVNLAADGTIQIGGKIVPRDELPDRLRETAGPAYGNDILIKADAGLPFGAVRNLMSAVHHVGFTRVGLVTDQRNEM